MEKFEEMFLTEKQLARRKRNQAVWNEYKTLVQQYPRVSDQRLFDVIGKKYGMTTQSVRNICALVKKTS